MSAAIEREQVEIPEIREAAALLGGPKTLRKLPVSPLDAHEMLARGLPPQALEHLLDNLLVLKPSEALERAIGMSGRTLQRRRQAQAKPLDTNQSIRTWVFAKILSRATAVFGSQEEAERWLESPAMGLDQWRPLDLLATSEGAELVEDFLDRLEYGVYT
ncbi:MAG TPA: antitoxin Xre/MbcA/ParS toxin-binding domain-containing protein [Kiloniellales bacterium]|nr:antitoxin Xre/MbcA/ParS toxin-binding domain-containing protein [Kiloniellales bacterium]